MTEPLPKRKQLHLKTIGYKDSGDVYFITICTYDKKPIFTNHDVAGKTIHEIQYRRAIGEISVYCYCLMPYHLHLLLSLGLKYDKTLQNWVAAFKRYTAREMKEAFAIAQLWQKNFYDHVIRYRGRSQNGTTTELIVKAQYILNNPVRKMLTSTWEDYPFCGMPDPPPV